MGLTSIGTSLRQLSSPGDSLSQRAVRAGFWVAALRGVHRLLTTVRTIVLARLLGPADFGVIGVALLTIALVEALTKTGFRDALIQRNADIRAYLDPAWTVEAVRGVVLAAGLFLAAPAVSAFFNSPESVAVIRVVAAGLLLSGLKNIAIVYFDKDLEFRKRFLLQSSQTLAEVGVGIALALILRNVWALVYGILAGHVVEFIMSYVLHTYRPRPRLDLARIKEMHMFGRWISMGSIVFFVSNRADGAVVGRLLGPAALGAYEMGQRFAELATREITTVSNIVSFPLFSKLQNSLKVKRAFLMNVDLVTSVTWPVTVGMFLLATPLVDTVLGRQWAVAAPILPVLTASGALRALSATGGALYQGLGRPDYDFKQSLLRIVASLALMVPLIQWVGIAGAAYAVLIGAVLIMPFLIHFSRRLVGYTLTEGLLAVAPAAALSFGVGLAIQLAVGIFGALTPLSLVATIALASVAYVATAFLLWKTLGAGPIGVVRRRRAAA